MAAPKVDTVVAVSSLDVNVSFDQSMLQDANFFLVSNWAVSGHTVILVSAPNTTSATIKLGEEMLQGAALTATVDASLENLSAETMDLAFLTGAFTGEGIAPQASGASTPADKRVRITFNEGLQINAALLDIASYAIKVNSIGAVPLIVNNVAHEPVLNPTFVDLYVNEMTDGADYIAIVEGALLDIAGNQLDPGDPSSAQAFVGQATVPEVDAAEVLAGGIIRIDFNKGMKKDAQLSLPSNYIFTPITAGAAQLFFDSISVPDIDEPDFVEISTSEMTDGASYEVTINGPTDVAFNQIGATDTAPFTGEGIAPVISSLVSVSKNRVDVVFSEAMRVNPDILDIANYNWTAGLTTLEVLEVTAAGVVKLATSDQIAGILYELTVTP